MVTGIDPSRLLPSWQAARGVVGESPRVLVENERSVWERLLADPVALEQARLRAAQHSGTARWFTPPDGSLETPPWEPALALTQSDAWFLHDRP